jgi:soluble lytic murein transglycosylase-like protein
MPATWAGSWNPYRAHSSFEPRYAVLAGARYLRRLLDQTGGDVPRALAAYNAGLAGSAGAWPAETRAYVARIMRRFGGAPALVPGPGSLDSPGIRLLPGGVDDPGGGDLRM